MYVMQPFSINQASTRSHQHPIPGFVVFRRLDMHDFHDVKQLGDSAFADMAYPDTYWCSMLSDQTDIIVVGCHDGPSGKLIGFIAVAPDARTFLPPVQQAAGDMRTLFDYFGKCSYILSLCVSVSYRQLGFARQLVGKTIEQLRALEEPSALLFLHVADDNAGAIRFYTRTGFSSYSKIPGYYRTRAGTTEGLSSTARVYALSICGLQIKPASCVTSGSSIFSRTASSLFGSLRLPFLSSSASS